MAKSAAKSAKRPVETPRQTFGRQLRATRQSVGMSQAVLADKVKEVGGKLHSTAIARIETGDRDVSLEDALVIAAALDVSPLHLIVPRDNDHDVRVVPDSDQTYEPWRLRDWIRGRMSLDQDNPWDSETYTRERPHHEYVRDQQRAYQSVTILEQGLAADIALSVPGAWPNSPMMSSTDRLGAIEDSLQRLTRDVLEYVKQRRGTDVQR